MTMNYKTLLDGPGRREMGTFERLRRRGGGAQPLDESAPTSVPDVAPGDEPGEPLGERLVRLLRERLAESEGRGREAREPAAP